MTEGDDTLSDLFDKSLSLHEEILKSMEDTRSDSFQNKVKKGILMLEDATRLVSVVDIFSRNENFREISTEHLKYFLLPVLLGDLSNKVTERPREEIVETVQVYYVDFLQRCKDYEISDELDQIPDVILVNTEELDTIDTRCAPARPDLGRMNAERDKKLARYKESKDLEKDINNLRGVLSGSLTRDEDVVRRYHLKLIQKFINTTLDELCSLEMEVGVLKHMAKVRSGAIPNPMENKKEETRKLQPIIITKDKLQKEVYGIGYPSRPVLSVDEFYEKRVAEGWWKPPSSNFGALQDRAANPEMEARLKEEEERKEDDKEDRDDLEALEKARAWSDWKDDHRRGEGNRHNMG